MGKLHSVHPVDSANFRVGHQQHKAAVKNIVLILQNLPKIWHDFPNNVK